VSWGIEAIGITAGALVFGAMAAKRLVVIKAFLLAGAIGFFTYGMLLSLPAIIIINSIGMGVAIYGLVSAIRTTKKA